MTHPPPFRSRAGMVRIGAGSALLVLGVIGLFVPILQGILFLAIGALLLAPYVRFFRKVKVVLFRRHPLVRRTVHRWRDAWHRRRTASRRQPE